MGLVFFEVPPGGWEGWIDAAKQSPHKHDCEYVLLWRRGWVSAYIQERKALDAFTNLNGLWWRPDYRKTAGDQVVRRAR